MRFKIKVKLKMILVIFMVANGQSYGFQENNISAFDIIITEILADPFPVLNLPESEYIEIFNNTEYDLELKDISLIVGTKKAEIPLRKISSGEYLILCPDNKVALFKNKHNCIGISGFPLLRNSGQNISIVNKEEIVICFALYEKSWYKDAFKAEGGWSLEIIDPDNPCTCFSNWTSSENNSGGTPGRINSVNNYNPDLDAPYPLRISYVDNTTIRLIFNEPMNFNSINQLGLYTVKESNLIIINAEPIAPDYTMVELSLSDTINKGIIYKLEMREGSYDCAKNFIKNNNNLFFTQAFIPEVNDVVINEIMFKALPGKPEFIEIFNRSGKCIDLSDLYMCKEEPELSNPIQVFDGSYLLFNGNYIVITTNKNELIYNYNCPYPDRILNVKSFISLPDNGGKLYIINRLETIIDELHYSPEMHHPLISFPAGISLERISTELRSSDLSNWHSASASSGYASPGFRNTQAINNVSNSKILLKPEVFSPNNDGYNDVLSISYNFIQNGFSGSVIIYDANGRLIKKILNNGLFGISGSFFWNGRDSNNKLCPAGIYIVFIESLNMEGKIYHFRKCCVLGY